jgi:hypothetical protein
MEIKYPTKPIKKKFMDQKDIFIRNQIKREIILRLIKKNS